ncbi:hypothetical protein BKA70DRAFT_1420472 [Coprinopsis sp. MPI-PUGE-AT-0042]|nr:hypothetical protein BKA70DRAFT_1420472 [Coprinopsis sp. MPI-PUGE-AT-0042]
MKRLERRNLSHPFLDSVFLQLPDALDLGNSRGTAPKTVNVHPQSYFGVEIGTEQKSTRLFTPLPTYLDKKIFAPGYHTLLDGLVHFLMYSPAGGTLPCYWRSQIIRLILEIRTRMGESGEPEVLKKLTTNEAKWYMGICRDWPSPRQIAEYKARQMRFNYQLQDHFPTSHLGTTVNARYAAILYYSKLRLRSQGQGGPASP